MFLSISNSMSYDMTKAVRCVSTFVLIRGQFPRIEPYMTVCNNLFTIQYIYFKFYNYDNIMTIHNYVILNC